jgi:hypothetical protein
MAVLLSPSLFFLGAFLVPLCLGGYSSTPVTIQKIARSKPCRSSQLTLIGRGFSL